MLSTTSLFMMFIYLAQQISQPINTPFAPPCQLPQSWVGQLEYSPTQGWQIEVETDFPDGGFIFARVGSGWQGWIHPSKPTSVHALYHFTEAALNNEPLPCTIAFAPQLQYWLNRLRHFDLTLTTLFLPFISW